MTERVKELKVLKAGNGNMFRIGFEGGGEVPRELDGLWTSERVASMAVDAFLLKEERAKAEKKTRTKKEPEQLEA